MGEYSYMYQHSENGVADGVVDPIYFSGLVINLKTELEIQDFESFSKWASIRKLILTKEKSKEKGGKPNV
jgi:hypothetical protein